MKASCRRKQGPRRRRPWEELRGRATLQCFTKTVASSTPGRLQLLASFTLEVKIDTLRHQFQQLGRGGGQVEICTDKYQRTTTDSQTLGTKYDPLSALACRSDITRTVRRRFRSTSLSWTYQRPHQPHPIASTRSSPSLPGDTPSKARPFLRTGELSVGGIVAPSTGPGVHLVANICTLAINRPTPSKPPLRHHHLSLPRRIRGFGDRPLLQRE